MLAFEQPATLVASKENFYIDKLLALPAGKHRGVFGLAQNGKVVARDRSSSRRPPPNAASKPPAVSASTTPKNVTSPVTPAVLGTYSPTGTKLGVIAARESKTGKAGLVGGVSGPPEFSA